MKSFIHEDFLLHSKAAKTLYHDYASKLPIIDYHCHLSPADIAIDRQFDNLSSIWLAGDHYKWRAMRTLGIDEKFITGAGSDTEKFNQWAYAVPYTLRNPLYHWTHLELKRYFNIDSVLSPDTASEIYSTCSTLLKTPAYSTLGLLKKMKVEVICTTDDPIDSLEHHQQIQKRNSGLKVLPTFRPDKAYAVDNPTQYTNYLNSLATVSKIKISTFEDLLDALQNRINYFHENGGRLSDHGLEQLYFPEQGHNYTIDVLFKKLKSGETLSSSEKHFYSYTVLSALGKMYHSKGWVQQFHLGALRNTNQRMLAKLGPDTGFDSIGDFSQAKALASFLNELDRSDQLAKTILYNLNPSDNEVMGTMSGNFNDGS